MRKRKQVDNQIEPEQIWGKEWRTDPIPISSVDGQIDFEQYYDDSVLGTETDEEEVRRKMQGLTKCRIMHRTIIAGEHVESEIYPIFSNQTQLIRKAKKNPTREAQKNLNHINAQKYIKRMIHANFGKNDLIFHPTYEDGYYPTLERARKDMQNYIKSVKRYRNKQGMPPLKYVYVIEYALEGERTKKIRFHHHIIMSAMDRDVAERLWKKGKRRRCEYAAPDEDYGLEGFALYISKLESDGHHRITCSRNLKKPVIHKCVTRLSRKQMREMVLSGDGIEEIIKKVYKDRFRYIDTKIYYSDWVSGFYIYSRLKKKEAKNVEGKENALSDRHLKEAKIYLDSDWKGPLSNGESCYSIVLEAQVLGRTQTKEYYGVLRKTTKNRSILHQLTEALGHFKEPCQIEIHTSNRYLNGGFMLNRFERAKKSGYANVKNADLIAALLEQAEGHHIRIVMEEKNEYSRYEQMYRKKHKEEMEVYVDER